MSARTSTAGPAKEGYLDPTGTPRQRSRRLPRDHGRSSSPITGPDSSTGALAWATITASASTTGACPSTSPGQAHAMRDSTDNDARSAVEPRQAEAKMVSTAKLRSPLVAGGSVPCTCGHNYAAHRHYRSGGECAPCRCPDWRPTRGLRRVVALLRVGHAGCDRAPPTSTSRPRQRCSSGAPTVRLGAHTAAVIAPGLRGRSSAGLANVNAFVTKSRIRWPMSMRAPLRRAPALPKRI